MYFPDYFLHSFGNFNYKFHMYSNMRYVGKLSLSCRILNTLILDVWFGSIFLLIDNGCMVAMHIAITVHSTVEPAVYLVSYPDPYRSGYHTTV